MEAARQLLPLRPAADALSADQAGRAMVGRSAGQSSAAFTEINTGPAVTTQLRLAGALNAAPRVSALQQLGRTLSGAAATRVTQRAPAVVQRIGARFELFIPANRSHYNKELRGHAAYRWIETNRGMPAITAIKNVAALIFRDGGMFVQSASRAAVEKLLADANLARDVAIDGEAVEGGDAVGQGDDEPVDEGHGEDGGEDQEEQPAPDDAQDAGDHDEDDGDEAAEHDEAQQIADLPTALPDHVVDTMKAINRHGTVRYPYHFSEADFAEAAAYFASVGYHGDLAEARTGFADPRYFEKTGRFTWILRPNVSAAQAITSFVNLADENVVIAECQTTAQAVEYYAILQSVGQPRFDQQLGSAVENTPEERRLRLQFNLDPSNPIKQLYEDPRADFDAEERRGLGEDDDGLFSAPNRRPAKRGGRYFIKGSADYVKRHPEGFLGGENAFYYGDDQGEQRFGGLGIENESEVGITAILANAFNAPQTPTEANRPRAHGAPPELYADELPAHLRMDPENPAQIAPTHRAGELDALARAQDGQDVQAAGLVNAGAVWRYHGDTVEMDRSNCPPKYAKVSLATLAGVFAATFGLEMTPGLVRAIRAVNEGALAEGSDKTVRPVATCTFPNPRQLLRLKKGPGFQATSALVLDPEKVRAKFFPPHAEE